MIGVSIYEVDEDRLVDLLAIEESRRELASHSKPISVLTK
jgi:hypothetical protein